MTKLIHFPAFCLLFCFTLLASSQSLYAKVAEKLNINTFSESGPLYMNGAEGSIEKVNSLQKIIYTLPPGGIIGSWNKGSNKVITLNSTDFINIEAKLQDIAQSQNITVTVELKGDKGIQNLSVPFQKSSCRLKEFINWELIGNFKELVFLVCNNNLKNKISGSVDVDISFSELSYLEKNSLSLSGKFLFLTLLSALSAILFYILGIFLFNNKSSKIALPNSILREILLALSISMILWVTFASYALGDLSLIERSNILYLIPFSSVLVGAMLKFIYTGRLTTPFESFRNAFFPGLLAVTTTSATTWLRPYSWMEMCTIGCLGAATFVFLYHILNIYRFGTAKKHLGFAGSFFLTSVPYLFGLLLALQDRSLFIQFINFEADWFKNISNLTTLSPEYFITITAAIASFAVIFFFTEFTCNAFSILYGKRLLVDRNAHKKIVILSLGLVIAPFIADLGSGAFAGDLPVLLQSSLSVITTVIAQGMLWAFVFMITGIILDAIRGEVPAAHTIHNHARKGRNNGMMYSGILMTIIQGIYLFCHADFTHKFYEIATFPLLIICGALLFPLIKTIIETFDGSHAFFVRARESYKKPLLYARGIIVGFALALAISMKISDTSTEMRILFGIIAGAIAFGGISFVMDFIKNRESNEESKSWRKYLLESGMGAFIGAAICFYLDSNQISVIITRFNAYNTFATIPKSYSFNNLVSAWGNITLSDYSGGAKLLYNQALNGVIAWGVAAWLFALNKALLNAIFSRDMIHIKRIGTREGMTELAEGTIRVLRWGLWMSPIIFTFLKQMDVATWYNQDGAVRTVFASANNLTMTTKNFHDWSLNVFMWVMAYDFFRILIWMDHMGLRVASLVNLSFIGMETLDSSFVRFVNKSGSAIKNIIPEGVQRFMTWAPLLIPYYIPAAGMDWDYAWNKSSEIQSSTPAYIATLFNERLDIVMISLLIFFVLFAFFLILKHRHKKHSLTLSNMQYKIGINEKTGIIRTAMFAAHCNIDATRRNYDKKLSHTPALYLFDTSDPNKRDKYQLFGEFYDSDKNSPVISRKGDSLNIIGKNSVVKSEITFSIPVKSDQVAFIDISLENISDIKRNLKLVPYFEWALDRPSEDKARIIRKEESQEMLIEPGSNSIYCIQPTKGVVGFLASDIVPKGYIRKKSDFISDNHNCISNQKIKSENHAQNALGHIDFNEFNFERGVKSREWISNPAGALLLDVNLMPGEIKKIRLITGCAFYEAEAVNFVKSYLRPRNKEYSNEERNIKGTCAPASEVENINHQDIKKSKD